MKTNRRNFIKTAAAGMAALGLSNLDSLASPSIMLPVPEREGSSVMNLSCEPLKTVRIGLIGLGMRGMGTVERLLNVEGCEITAVCDVVPERVAKAQQIVKEKGRKKPAGFSKSPDDWMKLCERDNVDLVYCCTPWALHTPNAVYAMNQGKHATIEVPGATTLEECWELVNTAEKTQRHCMMLENCCYDFFELATLNMARQGALGDIMHAECAYIHDLRWLKFDKTNGYWDMWRLQYSKWKNGNLYPTHGLGPVAQIMDINRGDRMEHLTSMSTNQVGMSLYAQEKFGPDSPEANQRYTLGDMNTTLVKTFGGKTIMIQHDTSSPRPYSRIHLLSGTKGIARKWPSQKIALEPNAHKWLKKDAFQEVMKEYEHPLSKQIGEKAREVGGHGGMDFIMDYRLIYCLRNGLPLDQDVYDAATWSSIVELSEISVKNRSNSVSVPDFTRSAWETAKPWGIVKV